MYHENKTDTSDREISSIRTLNAPRDLVWKVWTDPEHIKNWWGPNGFTNTIHKMEVKAGGEWEFIMHGPDGRDYFNKIIFDEVVEPERLVYRHFGNAEDPVSFHAVVTFEDEGGKTRLTMKMVFPTAEERDWVDKEYGAIEGQKQTLNRLEHYLKRVASNATV